jgi:hypothetical protein
MTRHKLYIIPKTQPFHYFIIKLFVSKGLEGFVKCLIDVVLDNRVGQVFSRFFKGTSTMVCGVSRVKGLGLGLVL